MIRRRISKAILVHISTIIHLEIFADLRGDIHTQVATVNVNMTLGGWGFNTLTLLLWQNETSA